jgi:hypothetical protein
LKPNLEQVVFLRGRLGVQNAFDEWESHFRKFSDFSLTILPIERDDKRLAVMHARFRSAGEVAEFLEGVGFQAGDDRSARRIVVGDLERCARRLNDFEILLVESSLGFPGAESYCRLVRED